MRLLLPLGLALLASGASAQTATYRVTLEATWSAQTHPDGFPPNPHFSPLVGAIHNADVHLWASGEMASPGIEAMAEIGSTSGLVAEAEALVASGAVREAITGGAVGLSPGSVSLDIELTPAHSRVTLVSMLAPSPDWFVGTDALDLRAGGAWASEVVVPLYVWDAGTDSGTDYTSPDADTDPQEPIARIEAPPFVVGGTLTPVGTMTFSRRMPASGEAPPEASVALNVSAGPHRDQARFTAQASGEAQIALFDVRGRRVRDVFDGPLAGPREMSLDLSGLASGVYLLRLVSGREVVARRIVVAR